MRLCDARARAWKVSGVAGLVLASWSSPAGGTELDLAWSAPAGCPSGLEIVEATRARLPEATSSGPPTVVVQGTVTAEHGAFVVALALKDAAGEVVGERRVSVEGESCKAVEGAAALLLAIMIAARPEMDDAADTGPAPRDQPPSPPDPPASAPPSRPLASPRSERAVAPAAEPSHVARPDMSLGLAGVTSLGLLPGVGLGVALRGTYAFGTRLLFGVEAGFDAGGTVHAATGEVRFHAVSGAALAGLRLSKKERPTELILTVAARAGAILVQPRDFAVVHSQVGTAALGGPGVLVRARLGPRLLVDVWPEIDAVFVRDRFRIRDGDTFEIHRPSVVSGRLSVGLGYELR